jgi:hypothetical protein
MGFANVVELQLCVELEDMVHMTMKVERQIKKKGQYTFSDQFDFIFLNMEAEFEER